MTTTGVVVREGVRRQRKSTHMSVIRKRDARMFLAHHRALKPRIIRRVLLPQQSHSRRRGGQAPDIDDCRRRSLPAEDVVIRELYRGLGADYVEPNSCRAGDKAGQAIVYKQTCHVGDTECRFRSMKL